MSVYDILYPYQRDAVDRIVTLRRQGLFDDPGTGKTKMALASIERGVDSETPRVLVLATQTGAKLTWMRETEEGFGDDWHIQPAFDGLLSKRHDALGSLPDKPTIVIANHAFLGTKGSVNPENPVYNIQWDAIVIDEGHRVLPVKVDRLNQMTYFWKGMSRIQAPSNAIRLAMSGTPDRGKLEHRYGTWAFLLPERFNSAYPYTQWLGDTFILDYKRVPIKVRGKRSFIDVTVPKGVKNEDVWNRLDDLMTLRRTKAEVAKWLPPKRYIDIYQELPAALDKAYDTFANGFTDDGTPKSADNFAIRGAQFATCEWSIVDVVDGTKTKKVAIPIAGSASWKRDWLVNWLSERGYDDGTGVGRVVVTSQFTRVLHWLKDELVAAGIPLESIGIIDGGMSTNNRLAVQRSFQGGGDIRIVLLSMSLGDSIDLDAADDMIFVDEVHDPDKTTQTEDRVHRVSRNHNVFIWRLRSIGTLDEARAATNATRYAKTRRVYDGRRGVEFARKIIARLGK